MYTIIYICVYYLESVPTLNFKNATPLHAKPSKEKAVKNVYLQNMK